MAKAEKATENTLIESSFIRHSEVGEGMIRINMSKLIQIAIFR